MFSQLLAALSANAPSGDEIKTKLGQGALLIDVRSSAEHAANRVPGAKNIPLDQLAGFAAKAQDKSQPIVVHCLSGGRANQAMQFLKANGFTDVSNAGGLAQIQQILA